MNSYYYIKNDSIVVVILKDKYCNLSKQLQMMDNSSHIQPQISSIMMIFSCNFGGQSFIYFGYY